MWFVSDVHPVVSLACVAVFSVSSLREKTRAKGQSRERMGREQKEKRGEGWEGKEKLAAEPGGYSQKNWEGACGSLLKSLTLFMTKVCDFPYSIYDLTKNLKPYL